MSRFEHAWARSRTLTLDLLADLGPEELLWAPGPAVGPIWHQFRHLGRIQSNYVEALDRGHMKFGPPDAPYEGGPSADSLAAYLEALDQRLVEVVDGSGHDATVDWFGEEEVGLDEHLARLVDHETLHHGSLTVYLRLLGRGFPPSWESLGL